jgi:hypothetical protein
MKRGDGTRDQTTVSRSCRRRTIFQQSRGPRSFQDSIPPARGACRRGYDLCHSEPSSGLANCRRSRQSDHDCSPSFAAIERSTDHTCSGSHHWSRQCRYIVLVGRSRLARGLRSHVLLSPSHPLQIHPTRQPRNRTDGRLAPNRGAAPVPTRKEPGSNTNPVFPLESTP